MPRREGLLKLSFVDNVRELDSGPRKFLQFTAFNVVSWQCIVGSILVLFARHIGMPPAWVGFLISFMPLSMMLAVFTVPIVARFGSKRVMFSAWLVRNLLACSVFLMPWAILKWGPRAGWYGLMAVTLAFCLIRAMGAPGWWPWLHEMVPSSQSGRFFSAQTGITQSVNVGVVLGQGLILSEDPTLDRFLIIYAIGITAGLVSLMRMLRLPGGGRIEQPMGFLSGMASYRTALADRGFVRYLITGGLGLSCVSWLQASLVLYMRDALLVPPRRIMIIMAGASFAVLLTVHYWGKFAEHSGSGRAMFKTLLAYACAALACLGLVPGAAWTPYALPFAVALATTFAGAFGVSANGGALNQFKDKDRLAYANLWILTTSVSMGLTPIAAGQVIEYGGVWGFRTCFLIAGTAGIITACMAPFTVRDGEPIVPHPAAYLNPAVPLRTLARIAWITAGLHESNRDTRETKAAS